MIGDNIAIYLSKGDRTIHFNIPIKTSEGRTWAIQMDRSDNRSDNNEPELSLASPMEMNLDHAHY
jgi:hypothetical protein